MVILGVGVVFAELMFILKSSDHTQVLLPNHTRKLIFVPEHMADHPDDIKNLCIELANILPTVGVRGPPLLTYMY